MNSDQSTQAETTCVACGERVFLDEGPRENGDRVWRGVCFCGEEHVVKIGGGG